jgi:hypothetical protein
LLLFIFDFPESVGQMGKTYSDWADRDEQLNPDFFGTSEAIYVAENPTSQIELSDEEREEPTVAVRFDSEGFAEEEEPEEEPRQPSLLEPLPTPFGASDWGACFAETLARCMEMTCVSKPTHIRYESRGGHVVKFSSLPSASDFVCDVVVVARKCMSPALYRLFKTIYLDSYGENASSIPLGTQALIQQKSGRAFMKCGLYPFNLYWKKRVDLSQIRELTLLDPVEDKEKLRAARNKRRRARRKAGRPVITTLKQAA